METQISMGWNPKLWENPNSKHYPSVFYFFFTPCFPRRGRQENRARDCSENHVLSRSWRECCQSSFIYIFSPKLQRRFGENQYLGVCVIFIQKYMQIPFHDCRGEISSQDKATEYERLWSLKGMCQKRYVSSVTPFQGLVSEQEPGV